MKYIRNKGRTCSLSGCVLPAKGKGLCSSHLQRYWRAKLTNTLELGFWKSKPAYRGRVTTKPLTIRWPVAALESLESYAELRGLSRAAVIVELALHSLNERGARGEYRRR